MQHLKQILATLALGVCALEIQAGANYNSNPYSPYPPSCLTTPLNSMVLEGPGVARFYRQAVSLEVVSKLQGAPASENLGDTELSLYRVACAEPDRSVIIAEFRLPSYWVDPRKSTFFLPLVRGVTGFDSVPFVLKAEPNLWGESIQQHVHTKPSFGDYSGGWYDMRGAAFRYVLDINAMGGWWDRSDLADYYNGQFGLTFMNQGGPGSFSVLVPSTHALLATRPQLPFSGRLAGNWVETGATDQGLVISVSTLVPAAQETGQTPELADLLLFMSWFTFDAQGRTLWLTGSARIAQGAGQADLNIERVTQGQFMGPRLSDRAVVGNATLKAVSCNRLELQYNLAGLGLGAGTATLQRIASLEIADHPCRDFAALQAGL